MCFVITNAQLGVQAFQMHLKAAYQKDCIYNLIAREEHPKVIIMWENDVGVNFQTGA